MLDVVSSDKIALNALKLVSGISLLDASSNAVSAFLNALTDVFAGCAGVGVIDPSISGHVVISPVLAILTK
jgi:hypothetical protein